MICFFSTSHTSTWVQRTTQRNINTAYPAFPQQWLKFGEFLQLFEVMNFFSDFFPLFTNVHYEGENKTPLKVYIPEARPARKAAPRLDMSAFAGFSIFLLIKSEVICMTKLLLLTPPSAL